MRYVFFILLLIGCTSNSTKTIEVGKSDSINSISYNSHSYNLDSNILDTIWRVTEGYYDVPTGYFNYVFRVKKFELSSQKTSIKYTYYCDTVDPIIPRYMYYIYIKEGKRMLSVEFDTTVDNIKLLSTPLNKVNWSKIKFKNALDFSYDYFSDWEPNPSYDNPLDTFIRSRSPKEIKILWNKYIKYFKVCNMNR